jgi:hypothetical protein
MCREFEVMPRAKDIVKCFRPDLLTIYWDEMVKNVEVKEDIANFVIDSYLKCKAPEAAVNLLFKLKSYGITPRNEAYLKILKTYEDKQRVLPWIEKLETSETLDKEERFALKKFMLKVFQIKHS